jgi:predicted hotdog family 3-hydroxylacyl-ACP dehydratase
MIDRNGIAALIPHAGRMCLLDRVDEWNETLIRCIATSHSDADNPLAVDGTLGAACGVEYAAQAMAIHGGLARPPDQRPRSGFLISMRAVAMAVDRLDDLGAELIVQAERLAGSDNEATYDFSLRCGEMIVLSGRATVLLDAEKA